MQSYYKVTGYANKVSHSARHIGTMLPKELEYWRFCGAMESVAQFYYSIVRMEALSAQMSAAISIMSVAVTADMRAAVSSLVPTRLK